MGVITSLIHTFVERRASKTTLETLREELETQAEEIIGRINSAADTPDNRAQAGHVIGIERWGVHRLKEALDGDPDVPNAAPDGYDGYRPDPALDMPALAELFRSTRAETLHCIDAYQGHEDQKALHNDLGLLSARAWFVYLLSHAGMESKRIRS